MSLINYNLKDLEKRLESYDRNIEKVSEFINKDVARVLQENGKKIDDIRKDNEVLSNTLSAQEKTVETLIATFRETNSLLRDSVEKSDVNEAYLFEVLDKWATSRKIKFKRQ